MSKFTLILSIVLGLVFGYFLMGLFKALGANFITIGDVVATYFFSTLFSVIATIGFIVWRGQNKKST